MSRAAVAWVLNLDADVELAAAPAYQPTNAVRAAMAPHVVQLAASLIAPDDVLIDETSASGIARGLVGRAFCPTPRAIAMLRRAGAEPEAHPTREILRSVNDRAFCASLGATLPDGAFHRELDSALHHLERVPTIALRWRVKRAFGMAGRGQRVVPAGSPLADADHVFVRAGIGEGGVQIEPNVPIERELAQHGMLGRDGSLRTGRLVVQECDRRGQWLSTRIADEDAASIFGTAVRSEVDRVAIALHAAGYYGPFGVDAFVYRDLQGRARLQPRSEINARYSMGFAVGFGRGD